MLQKSFKIIRVAVRSLFQHKLRAALSILGVICGVMAVLAMLAIGEGAKRETLSQIAQLGTKNIYLKALALTEAQRIKARERRSRGLSTYDANRIAEGCAGMEEVACLKEVSASIIGMMKELTPQIVGCSANYARVQNLFIEQGRFLADQDIERKNLVCVLGKSVAEDLGFQGKPGNSIRIENHVFMVVGILKRFDRKAPRSSVMSVRDYNGMIFIPLSVEKGFDYVVSQKGEGPNPEVTELIVRTKQTGQVLKAASIIKRIMEVSHSGVDDYQMVIPLALLQQAQKTHRTFNIVLGSIACISLLVGGIGIMNIMLATVSERTREIGIRRSVGATKEDIMFQFLVEAVLLTFFGGMIGMGAGIGSVWLITMFAGWQAAITLWSILLPLVMSILVGIFFGLYPAYQAAKMDPIAALRHE
jgi:putative ABC transport system permease protein